MYWSGEHQAYLPAPDVTGGSNKQDGDKKDDKKDKVKTAKRIAKDMEKWAKTLNNKKEAAKSNQTNPNPPNQGGVGLTKINIGANKNVVAPDQNNLGAEDIAFSMLNKREGATSVGFGATSNALLMSSSNTATTSSHHRADNEEPPPPGSRPLNQAKSGLVGLASYNSDNSDDESNAVNEEKALTDWSKMACLLCQRQFPSKEKLTK